MGLHLIGLLAAASSMAEWADYIWGISQGILGLGFVVFVHELGHFAVAKMCGVKCEKFYLGFDIGGLKLARFQWGETEYGVGILPLGGYVKMLGQDDNPARAAEERRRSTLADENTEGHSAQTLPGVAHSPSPPDAVLDPRSYMAKSVPQRMAIISAGVIMNVIFAFLMAALAFYLGVPETPCAISSLMPGGAAWRAGLEPGDKIIQINDRKADELPLRFRDLQEAVTLTGADEGVRFRIERPEVAEPFWVTITPDAPKAGVSLAPTIGAAGPLIPRLGTRKPAWPNTPAGKTNAFQPGDHIMAVDGHSIERYDQLLAQLARNANRTLEFSVERLDATGKAMKQVNLQVPPRPERTLGLVMRMGKVAAVQDNSPAAKAGVQADDFIVGIDGQPSGDMNVMELPELLRTRAGKEVVLSVSRKDASGQDVTVDLKVVPRDAAWFEGDLIQPGSPLTIPAIGVALKVLNIVQATVPESPAAEATVKLAGNNQPAPVDRLAPGDEIIKAELVPANAEQRESEVGRFRELTVEFVDAEGKPLSNWPFFVTQLQEALPDTKVRFTLRGDRYVELAPIDSATRFNPDRGFIFQPAEFTFRAHTVGQSFSMAAAETKRALLQVYSFLRLLGSRISVYALGGPGTIFSAAAGAADRGFSSLLLFLTMLSANLAVINFLPIPVLDGGHMVFLALEGIMRRPVSERVVLVFQYAGLIFILGLMLFVIGLDIKLIPRF